MSQFREPAAPPFPYATPTPRAVSGPLILRFSVAAIIALLTADSLATAMGAGPPVDDFKLGNHNFEKDRDATLRAIPRWPRPLIFVGREIGSVPSHLKGGARLAETPAGNPVRLAYQLYFGGTAKDRHLADPTTVLFAVRGLRDYWDIHATGHMDLHPDLTFDWKDGPPGNQAYLLKRAIDGKPNDHAIEQACEELMTQPPRHPGATSMPATEPSGPPQQ